MPGALLPTQPPRESGEAHQGETQPGKFPFLPASGLFEDIDVLGDAFSGHAAHLGELAAGFSAAALVEVDLVWPENRICLNLQGLRSFAGSR